MIQKHFIEVENEEKIAVTHVEADSGKFLFVCHGLGGNRKRQSKYLQLSEEINVVTIDFRGNGESDGEFIEQTVSSRIKDLEAAVEFFDPEEFFLFGTSLGGKIAFHAAPELGPDRVIGKSPVTYNSMMDDFRAAVEEKGEFEFIDGKPIDQRFYEDLENHSFSEVADNIDFPVMIFHGSADTTARPENSFRAAQELQTDVTFHKLEGEKHHYSEEAEKKVLEEILSFIDFRQV
jgi:pimeloyl-ACP methyl ester carboxylesterase